jgi:hypothetical protein
MGSGASSTRAALTAAHCSGRHGRAKQATTLAKSPKVAINTSLTLCIEAGRPFRICFKKATPAYRTPDFGSALGRRNLAQTFRFLGR